MSAGDRHEIGPIGVALDEHIDASDADEEYRNAREALAGSERIARLLIYSTVVGRFV